MNQLLILDKDQTLITPKSGEKYVRSPWDQETTPQIIQTLDKYKNEGWHLAIASNQGGVGWGRKSLESCFLEFRFVLELFPQIDNAFFCPDQEGFACYQIWGDCGEENRILYQHDSQKSEELDIKGKYRKPGPGMLILATDIYAASEVIFVGDREEDQNAMIAAQLECFWHVGIKSSFAWARNFFGEVKND